MDDFDSPDHQEELSQEDREVLQAFHDLEESTTSDDSFPRKTIPEISTTDRTNTDQYVALLSENDMLALFATEADEDITTMRLSVQQLEQANRLDSPGLKALKRHAHKVAGTAAAIGCDSMSTIAHHIEAIIKLVENGGLIFQTGLIALVNSVQALEATLHSLVSNGYESKNPLLELEEEYKRLNIAIQVEYHTKPSAPEAADGSSSHWLSQHKSEHEQNSSSLRVDLQHFHKLLEYTEKLIELDTPMENAQKQVETALNELQFAQARLRSLEPLLSSPPISANTTSDTLNEDVGHPPSSLVARILRDASGHIGHGPQIKNLVHIQPLLIHEAALWDEMEINRFSETNVLTHSLNEAITDVSLATCHLQQVLTHLKSIVAQQLSRASRVRTEAFLLQSLPCSVLVTRIRTAIEKMAGAQSERIQFEASGETFEINQEVLEKLTDPLLELVRMYIAGALFFTKRVEQNAEQSHRIWLNAHTTGNESTIEFGFSQAFPSVAVALLQDTVHRLYGSVSLQKHPTGKITLQLRIPRFQRIIQGLLVRVESQHVIVPVSQVKRIHYNKQGITGSSAQERNSLERLFTDTHEVYHLNRLLGVHTDKHTAEKTVQTALVLELDSPQLAIEVDEVVKEVELVMKPLSAHLCRPGITSTAIDGEGNVHLVLNLPEMLKLKEIYQQAGEVVIEADGESDHELSFPQPGTEACRKVLIADDSMYIRQSINRTLSHEGYNVLEAIDGLQTLEQLSKESPDLLLLDVEMPNLNGYDVLSIVRTHQEFSALKIVLLTSRSSEKHKRRARELGAHEYLTKPCSQDVLLKTIKSLLGEEKGKIPEEEK